MKRKEYIMNIIKYRFMFAVVMVALIVTGIRISPDNFPINTVIVILFIVDIIINIHMMLISYERYKDLGSISWFDIILKPVVLICKAKREKREEINDLKFACVVIGNGLLLNYTFTHILRLLMK